MKNIDDEVLFKLVKYHLNKSYHERKDAVIHTGTGLTQPAQWYRDFAQAVIDVVLKDLALDAERLDWLIEQGCSNGVVYEFDKSFWMVWLDGHDAHKDKHQISRYHTAREAVDAARSPAAMAKLIMHCTTEDEYRAAITQCIDARKAAIAAAKEKAK